VIELADHGLTETEITQRLRMPVGVVRARLTRWTYGETLKALCRAFGFEGCIRSTQLCRASRIHAIEHAGSMRPTSRRYTKPISSWPTSTISGAWGARFRYRLRNRLRGGHRQTRVDVHDASPPAQGARALVGDRRRATVREVVPR
jgi:hypothetical protein